MSARRRRQCRQVGRKSSGCCAQDVRPEFSRYPTRTPPLLAMQPLAASQFLSQRRRSPSRPASTQHFLGEHIGFKQSAMVQDRYVSLYCGFSQGAAHPSYHGSPETSEPPPVDRDACSVPNSEIPETRKRGRPRGSKNKSKAMPTGTSDFTVLPQPVGDSTQTRPRGRPRKTIDGDAEQESSTSQSTAPSEARGQAGSGGQGDHVRKRGPGRPRKEQPSCSVTVKMVQVSCINSDDARKPDSPSYPRENSD